MRKPDLLLVGYGRFGRLAARLLRPHWNVHVLERRRTCRIPRWIVRAKQGEIGRFKVVILAIPADRLKLFLERHGRRFGPGTFVADVCAVKAAPMRWMRIHLGGGVSYAGLHPLFGPDSFRDGARAHSIAVCRGRLSRECAGKLLKAIRRMGLRTVETTPVIHDRTMASTLFLTQIVGMAAGRAVLPDPPFVTPSFRHLHIVIDRASGNSASLAGEILGWNRSAPAALRKFKAGLTLLTGKTRLKSPSRIDNR